MTIIAPTTHNIAVNIEGDVPLDEIRAVAWGLLRLAAELEADGADDPVPTLVEEDEKILGRKPWLEAYLPVEWDWQKIGVDKAEGEWEIAMLAPHDGVSIADAKSILEDNAKAIFLAERLTERGL